MTYDEFLTHFKVVKRYENKAQCICPCHSDKTASLTVSRGNKGILLFCHAGCKCEDILKAADLEKSDMFFEDRQQKNSSWKSYVEAREQRKIEAVYNYVSSINGSYAFTKIRLQGKKLLYGKLENERFSYGIGRQGRKTYKAIYVPNGLEALNKAISDNTPIFICEGEKDVNTLASRGYTSFTYGSATDWQSDFATLLTDATVFVLVDNDSAGKQVAQTICTDIKDVVKSAKFIVPTPDIPKGDISDYFANHSKEDFEALLNTPLQENAKEPEKSLVETLKEIEAAKNFETNDKGYGSLFAEVFKDKHRYNPSIKDFMVYDGKKWIEDIEGLSAKSDAKLLSDALIEYAPSIDADYLKAVVSLCNIRNRENMLKDSKDLYYFSNEQLDTNDYLLNVQNGTLDLSEDTPKFIEHNPDMLLSKICNVEYEPNAVCNEWNKFLIEVMQGDTDKIKYLQKIAGISLTGNTKEETCFILYGSTTRNGKSTFCETLIYLLGNYALTMKPETLAVKQNLDSRQASGDIARLSGCRFVNASEPPKRMLFDTALLKSLLGRDSITARHLHQREFSFIPKFKLVMNTNYLPTITDDTVFSSGRINVISFDRHFTPEEQDKNLKNKLRDSKELSGILNWCIEGLHLYRREGLEPPQSVKDVTETYRSDSDKLGSFINECLTKTNKNSKAKDVYERYSEWCSDNGYGIENKGNFFSELKNKGIFATSGTVNGKTEKNIVKGYVLEEEFIPIKDNENLPFN